MCTYSTNKWSREKYGVSRNKNNTSCCEKLRLLSLTIISPIQFIRYIDSFQYCCHVTVGFMMFLQMNTSFVVCTVIFICT